jgi:predicted nucleic acid-binding protein
VSRIYWDTMLFVYWLEDREPYSGRIESIYARMLERGDRLFTSTFALGELLVGPRKIGDSQVERKILDFFEGGEVGLLPFDHVAADRYGSIRATTNVSPADAIHLACASGAGIDLLLTNDRKVRNLTVANIQFIDGLETSVF